MSSKRSVRHEVIPGETIEEVAARYNVEVNKIKLWNGIKPVFVDIEPKTIQWWVGEEPVEKTTTVKMNADTPMTIKNITATRDNVEFSWKEVTPGREYLVTVKPKSTKEVTLGALKIETDSTIPKYQRQLAFFSIYNKPAEAAKAP